MPANRTEGAPESEAATPAEAAPAASAPAAASGGIKAWLPLIVMTLLMPALAYAMTNFVLVPKLQKGLGGAAAVPAGETVAAGKSKKEAPGAKTESVPVNKLLVNVAGTMGARYLLVSLSVVGSGSDFKAQMDAHDAQLRDMAQSALATKTLADLEKPGARNMIRNELLAGFNNILGDGTVQEIYFPEFAIQ
ncbi:MAG TPA: flagellar basal body-associated FliL family protein [Verrucomicrobiae bacterium]|jgi:flagellar FliL protein|nr:flagellar basal body-associated FliL family protein [Verrucomicrobiae bacterium]